GLVNEGYGAEVRWNLNDLYSQGLLIPGHTYRFYIIVHDGDQNKSGGDCGQASFTYYYPGPAASQTASLAGFVYGDTGFALIPLSGVTLTLTGATTTGQQVTLTTTTAGDGSYSFGNLLPGTYLITQTVPLNYIFESDSVGTITNGTNVITGDGTPG